MSASFNSQIMISKAKFAFCDFFFVIINVKVGKIEFEVLHNDTSLCF